MLFSSPEFIFLFLPITLVVYFILAKNRQPLYARAWLLAASIFFYGWWNPWNIILIVTSMCLNFGVGWIINKYKSKAHLTVGVAANLGVLVYYKYSNFFLSVVNDVAGTHFPLLKVVLPLGVSFFTFTQIAFLVDNYQGKVGRYSFYDYFLFVTFFPHLIAGPIVHHAQLMPQFADRRNLKIDFDNLSKGLFVFNMGLAKKIVIADTFALVANMGYANTSILSTWQSWMTSFAYSLQLYFDFSGYSDMAIGLGLLFNIHFPINFNSPYKARNIQDFWRRWHMTLSRFLRDYLYIPLGGSRGGELMTNRNLLITFVLGGIWHGAGWTFIFWGFLHGVGQVIHRLFDRVKVNLAPWLGITITFLFVNTTWVFFRAPSWNAAINMLRSMTRLNHGNPDFKLVADYYAAPIWLMGVVLLLGKNSNEWTALFKTNSLFLWALVFMMVMNLLFLNSSGSKDFLYFDF